MTDLPRSEFRFTGWHMWMLAVAFFGVIFAVNIGLAVVSASSWTGMVVEDSYIAGQQFETLRKAHEAQAAAGWSSELLYEPGRARLVIVDRARRPVDLGVVTLLINRPVGGHEDQTLTLARQPDGSYLAPLILPNGAWDATVTATDTSLGPYELIRRFSVENGR